MYGPGGQRGDLADDVVDEGLGCRRGGADRVAEGAGTGVDGRCGAVAVQFAVGGEGGGEVPGHVDLGHDRDVAGGGVGNDLLVLRLGVVPAAAAAGLVDPPMLTGSASR